MTNDHSIRAQFSSNLTLLRQNGKQTQEQVATGIGVKLKRYQAWEEGRALPKLHMAFSICQYFAFKDLYGMMSAPIELPSY